jgi:hypothetical protein
MPINIQGQCSFCKRISSFEKFSFPYMDIRIQSFFAQCPICNVNSEFIIQSKIIIKENPMNKKITQITEEQAHEMMTLIVFVAVGFERFDRQKTMELWKDQGFVKTSKYDELMNFLNSEIKSGALHDELKEKIEYAIIEAKNRGDQ